MTKAEREGGGGGGGGGSLKQIFFANLENVANQIHVSFGVLPNYFKISRILQALLAPKQ